MESRGASRQCFGAPSPPFCHRDSLGVVLLKWTAPGSHSCGTGASAVGRCCRDSAGWASVARSASRRPPLSPPWVLAARVHPESEPGAQGEGPGLGSGAGLWCGSRGRGSGVSSLRVFVRSPDFSACPGVVQSWPPGTRCSGCPRCFPPGRGPRPRGSGGAGPPRAAARDFLPLVNRGEAGAGPPDPGGRSQGPSPCHTPRRSRRIALGRD